MAEIFTHLRKVSNILLLNLFLNIDDLFVWWQVEIEYTHTEADYDCLVSLISINHGCMYKIYLVIKSWCQYFTPATSRVY